MSWPGSQRIASDVGRAAQQQHVADGANAPAADAERSAAEGLRVRAMRLMIVLSLLLNVAVLVPVCAGLLADASWTTSAYGEGTPARAILLSIYMAIGLCSVLLLIRREPKAVAALLLVQVLYKVTTPLTVGTVANPVVVSNLVVAVIHSATLVCLWPGGALNGSTDDRPAR